MVIINKNELADMEKRYRTTLINSLPGYKGLHLLGTSDPFGNTNLALFNSVFHVGANPPLLGMVFRPDMPEHDALGHIQSTGCYTLNNVLPDWYQQAHQTSARYPSGVSEFEQCGFTAYYLDKFKAPFVKQSNIKIGLELRSIMDVVLNNTTIVIGEVVHIIIEDGLIHTEGYVDHTEAGTIAVAGLDSYFKTEPIGRLSYAKPGQMPEVLSNPGILS